MVVPSRNVHLCSAPCSNDTSEEVCRRHGQLAEELETSWFSSQEKQSFVWLGEPHGEGETSMAGKKQDKVYRIKMCL